MCKGRIFLVLFLACCAFVRPARAAPATQPVAPPEVAEYFQRLNAALRDGSFNAADFLDVKRMVAPLVGERANANLLASVTRKFTDVQEQQQYLFPWTKIRFTQVQQDGKDFIVVTRMVTDDGEILRFRWWLGPGDDGRLRFYDMEEIGSGIRISLAMAEGVRVAGSPQQMAAFQKLMKVRSLMLEGDMDAGAAALKEIKAAEVPDYARPVLYYIRVTLAYYEDRPADVVREVEAAQELGCAIADMYLVKSYAHAELEEFDKAEAAVHRYVEQMGMNEEAALALATALAGSGRKEAAAHALIDGLADAPTSSDLLVALAGLLPPEKQSLVGEKLAEGLANGETLSHDDFQSVGLDLESEETADALASVVEAYAKHGKPGPMGKLAVQYFAASALKYKGDHAAAAAAMEKLLEAEDEDYAGWAQVDYLESMAKLGKSLEAIRKHPDPPDAVAYYLYSYSSRETPVPLAELIAEVQKLRPDDARGWELQGDLLLDEERYADAEAAFAIGLKKNPDEATEQGIRRSWAIAAAKNGAAARAYREIYKGRDGFDLLAGHLSDDGDTKGLGELVSAHRAVDANDAMLPLWEAEVAYLSGDFARAWELFHKHKAAATGDDTRFFRPIHDRLVRSAVRSGRGDEALIVAREADAAAVAEDESAHYEVLAHVMLGDPTAAVAAARKALERGEELSWMYEDEDLSERLASPVFTEFRDVVPEPDE